VFGAPASGPAPYGCEQKQTKETKGENLRSLCSLLLKFDAGADIKRELFQASSSAFNRRARARRGRSAVHLTRPQATFSPSDAEKEFCALLCG
jgi:hypothetical protein